LIRAARISSDTPAFVQARNRLYTLFHGPNRSGKSRHGNSLLPKKRSKNHPLSKQERKDNRKISRERIFVEHAIRFVKRFRILSERYRNRRHRFALRFSLMAGTVILTVLPNFARNIFKSRLRPNGSRPLVGSSMISSSALWENASAKTYFIRVPFDKVLIFCLEFNEP